MRGRIGFMVSMVLVGIASFLDLQGAPRSADQLLASADTRIEEFRKADVTLIVTNAAGKPASHVELRVEQRRHAFLFGCNVFALYEYQGEQHRKYADRFSALFNYATLPFYWGDYEAQKGKTLEKNVERLAQWCLQQGMVTKGHPLVWHEAYPQWGPFEVEETEAALSKRIAEIVPHFKGLIDRWDVVNEATVSAKFDNGVGQWARRDGATLLVTQSLDWARAANPESILVYNDFNLGLDLEKLLAQLVENRASFNVIGLQSHMHNAEWPLERAWNECETYARFGKPLHFTELTVLSGEHGWEKKLPWPTTPEGERRQAAYVEQFYTLLFSHPAVEAITWWDLMDGGWQGAPAGLIRADLSPKPAFQRLLALVKGKWWTRAALRTEADGRCRIRGFLGDYQVTAVTPAGTETRQFKLLKGTNQWELQLIK